MQLGDLKVRSIHGGSFRLDGGAMFGVVPKPLWEKKSPPDDRNRIPLACNCLLVEAGGKRILIETGNGTKWTPKLRDIYALEVGNPLLDSLERQNVRPEQIDVVINTHLHFDHAGGNTHLENGSVVPTFPNARYITQRREVEHALNPTERDKASYFSENIEPIGEAGLWDLVEGVAEVARGISVEPIPGHNASIQAVKLSGGGKTLVFVADLFPTRHHLSLPWIMAYDLYPLQTLETKRKWLQNIVQNNWIVVFGHDPDVLAATLREVNGKIEYDVVDLCEA